MVHTQLIYERVNHEKLFVGMTNFNGNHLTRDDADNGANVTEKKSLM